METTSVQSLCNALARSGLLPADDVRAVFKRWRTEAGRTAEEPERFCKWLVARGYLTDYQAGMLQRGRADRCRLGQYLLLDRIGQGRMAGIYKAKHDLGQTVAVKILPPSKAKDATALARFQREARLARKLRHPNVVRTFQTGVDRGLYYLVMEYLDGETLEEVLQRRRKLPPAEAVRLVHQALLGLEHIHEQDMVHRDLKPANLMLVPGRLEDRPDDTLQATVKILDIGLGRALFDEVSPDQVGQQIELTARGDILGSPDYMAPEQSRNAHAADIRSDVYSLGCILYHCLTGQVPFPDSNPVRQMVRHTTEAPKPVRSLSPEVPEGLQQILDWMMHKDPAQRYPTPDRAAKALQVFLAAGTEQPARRAEAPAQMQPYLEWLKDVVEPEAPIATALPADEEEPAQPAEAAEVEVEEASPEPAEPAEAAEVEVEEASPEPAQVDVVLVPAQAPAEEPAQTGGGFRLGTRDLILLGVGGAVVLLALLVGLFLGGVFSRKPPADEPRPDQTTPANRSGPVDADKDR
jgi:serine/threonine protein kinase